MKNRNRWWVLIAVLALVAAACAGEDTEDTTVTTPADGATTTTGEEGATTTTAPPDEPSGPTGSISTYIGEPESLVTTNDTESEGIAVLRALYTPLVDLDPDNEPFMAAAESVETTDDGTTWVVTLRSGWTFHDGTPVTAQSYVDAWNYGAYGPNAQQNSGFFSGFSGFADLQCGTVTEKDEEGEDVDVADCENQPPAADALAGLAVDSDTQFTVTLDAPESFFPIRLVYPAYSPLPEAFFADPDGFNEMPIGTGPFMMAEPWDHNVAIFTTAYPDYAGDEPAQISDLEFRIFDDVNTAVNELLAGNLDIHDGVPPERASEIEGQVPNFDTVATSSINYLGMPWYDPDVGGPENRDLRAALSMAIDQEAITTAIFDGRRQPAYNLISPVIPTYTDNLCEAWSFDPDAAKELYDSTDGIPADLTFYFNAGAAHEDWIEAVTNQWAQNLGIDVTGIQFEGIQPFGDYLQRADEKSFDGPFRLGWGMDYPHPQNYWQLLLDSRFFSDAGGANSSFYANPEFDAKIDEALAITDLNEALPVWQEVGEIACNDVPVIPMFYGQADYAWNDTVSGVRVDSQSNVVYTELVAGG
jgi:ABC-type transport system substrate-binding protein